MMVLMMSKTAVGGIRTRATTRCGALMIVSPSSVATGCGGSLLTRKSKVNSCGVCQIARAFAYEPASRAGSTRDSNAIRGLAGGSSTLARYRRLRPERASGGW